MDILRFYGSEVTMLIVVAYDVNTETSDGRKRLRKIAKECVNYGQRVQNSVFECALNAAQYRMFQSRLLEIMDTEKDSLRFYNLGNTSKAKVEHFGKRAGYQADGVLIL